MIIVIVILLVISQLLTTTPPVARLDLYKATPSRNHSGVLGLAWVGGMCKGNYSCTINEATNFESAFVIAHELGHSLGIMHDGQRNRCDPNGFIMSERTGAGKVHWSKCSNSYLNDSIQRQQLRCLEVEQSNQVDSLYDLSKLRAPGQVYSIQEQCRLAFGANYSSYLAHQSPFNVSSAATTRHRPPGPRLHMLPSVLTLMIIPHQ